MKNEYKIDKCKSTVDFLSDERKMPEFINAFKTAKAVAWYYDEIVFYNIEDNNWNTPMKGFDELVRLRIFNKNEELHIWRSNGVLKGRQRVDSKGDETEYLDAVPLLNGTTFDFADLGIVATEEKGINYYLPYQALKTLVSSENRIVLKTRNYIGYSEIGQAGYVDCRFIDFEIIKKT